LSCSKCTSAGICGGDIINAHPQVSTGVACEQAEIGHGDGCSHHLGELSQIPVVPPDQDRRSHVEISSEILSA
jgi:hypothetical protein